MTAGPAGDGRADAAGSMEPTRLRMPVPAASTEVSALLLRPEGATALLVLGHGAGAGMDHAFLEEVAGVLAARGVATLRYNFPYMDGDGGWPPDRSPVLEATVRAAVAFAHDREPRLPLFVGGKSLGGRMTSRAAAAEPFADVRGIVFLGFPLHPRGSPATQRAEHLSDVPHAMLFVQGTRDRLAELELLEPVVEGLGERARIHVVEGADHSFEVLKRSGRTGEEVLDEVVSAVSEWIAARSAVGET